MEKHERKIQQYTWGQVRIPLGTLGKYPWRWPRSRGQGQGWGQGWGRGQGQGQEQSQSQSQGQGQGPGAPIIPQCAVALFLQGYLLKGIRAFAEPLDAIGPIVAAITDSGAFHSTSFHSVLLHSSGMWFVVSARLHSVAFHCTSFYCPGTGKRRNRAQGGNPKK